jgi:uncharacterized membrane protein
LVAILLSIALFSQAIYSDVVEYLKVTNQTELLLSILIGKWIVIIGSVSFSILLLLTMFHSSDKEQEVPNPKAKEKNPKPQKRELSDREQSMLDKKKMRTKAQMLLER